MLSLGTHKSPLLSCTCCISS